MGSCETIPDHILGKRQTDLISTGQSTSSDCNLEITQPIKFGIQQPLRAGLAVLCGAALPLINL